MLRYRGGHMVEYLPLCQRREDRRIFLVVCRSLFQGRTKRLPDFFPALGDNLFPFGGKGILPTGEHRRNGLIYMGLCQCTQQFAADQGKQAPFTGRQEGHILFCQFQRGDNGVVVGYILIGDHRRHIRSKSTNGGKQGQPCDQSGNRRNSFRHIPGEIPAVRPRIGEQLFLLSLIHI